MIIYNIYVYAYAYAYVCVYVHVKVYVYVCMYFNCSAAILMYLPEAPKMRMWRYCSSKLVKSMSWSCERIWQHASLAILRAISAVSSCRTWTHFMSDVGHAMTLLGFIQHLRTIAATDTVAAHKVDMLTMIVTSLYYSSNYDWLYIYIYAEVNAISTIFHPLCHRKFSW